MGLSTKASYGVAALFDLALSSRGDSVPVEEIARRQKIPSDYLRQLLIALRRAQLVESVRGTRGGYVLAKNPSQISIGEILQCLEGPLRLVGAGGANPTLRSYWATRQKEIEKIFSGTLQDLIDDKQRRDGNIVYHI